MRLQLDLQQLLIGCIHHHITTGRTDMQRTLILVTLALVPFTASAQVLEGIVRYNHTYPVLYDPILAFNKVAKEAVGSEYQEPPAYATVSRLLTFNSSSSLMYPTSKPAVEPRDRKTREGMEHIDTTYVDFGEDTITESRAFSGVLYLVKGEKPVIPWHLSDEERIYLGYHVLKATAEVDSTHIEAWFAPEIPIPAGPGMYSGLPGLILMITNASAGEVYAADSLALGALVQGISAPTRGRQLSDQEYNRNREAEIAESRRLWAKEIRNLEEGRTTIRKSSLSAEEILSNLNRRRRNQ